jgi:tRNA(Leu) C34 or U34 (ribose-2'-O)-methylase TrmL
MNKPKTTLLEKIHRDRSQTYAWARDNAQTLTESVVLHPSGVTQDQYDALQARVDHWDELWLLAMDDLVQSWYRNEQHRLYCLARTLNAHELMLESLRATETLTTDVEDRSHFESFSVEDSGSNAPPRSIHKSFMDYPRLLHDGGPPL